MAARYCNQNFYKFMTQSDNLRVNKTVGTRCEVWKFLIMLQVMSAEAISPLLFPKLLFLIWYESRNIC